MNQSQRTLEKAQKFREIALHIRMICRGKLKKLGVKSNQIKMTDYKKGLRITEEPGRYDVILKISFREHQNSNLNEICCLKISIHRQVCLHLILIPYFFLICTYQKIPHHWKLKIQKGGNVIQQFIQDFAFGGGSREHGGVLFSLEKSKISHFFKLENFQKMLKNQ